MKKALPYVLIVGVIFGIGTCNYIVNTGAEEETIANPQAGDYYVFNGFPEGVTGDQVFKIKEVREDEIEFYVPKAELVFGFQVNKSESKIREADIKGDMYGSLTIILPREQINQMLENDKLSARLDGKEGRIEYVFR